MKVLSWFMGSMVMAAFAGAVGCGGADGVAPADDTSAESALKGGGKKMSLDEFKKAMSDVAQWADNDPCSFSTVLNGGDVKVTVSADGKTGTVSMSEHETITFSQKGDGDSTTLTYKLGRAGKVTVFYASDAFQTVEVAPAAGPSATCEIDM